MSFQFKKYGLKFMKKVDSPWNVTLAVSMLTEKSSGSQTKKLELLFNEVSPYDFINDDGRRVFMEVAQQGSLFALRWLKNQGVDLGLLDNDGNIFHQMNENYPQLSVRSRPLEKGKLEKMVTFIQKSGADINAYNEREHTPLHLQTLFGRLKIVQIFMDKGADPNLCTKNGKSCLHAAVQWRLNEADKDKDPFDTGGLPLFRADLKFGRLLKALGYSRNPTEWKDISLANQAVEKLLTTERGKRWISKHEKQALKKIASNGLESTRKVRL